MKTSLFHEKLVKMDLAILTFLLLSLTLISGVASVCVHVPNEDMIEYSCTGGSPSDLYAIPERTEKMRIANMTLGRVTSQTFSRYGENLWVLTCTYCGITEIEPDAFGDLVNLQQLRLDNNYLRDVKAAWFVGMKYLTYLDLNYNEIEVIEEGVYDNLPSLVDLRISGNRLECLNIDAMSNMADLRRIFLGKNPYFKCPNAVSRFLESREVAFERDPDWARMPHDLVAPPGRTSDSRHQPSNPASTPSYHEKLVARTTTEDFYDYSDYEGASAESSPEVPVAFTVSTSLQTPYARNWPTSEPQNPDQGNWTPSMSSSAATWPTASSEPSYATKDSSTPAPIYRPDVDRPMWQESSPSGYGQTTGKPEVIVTSIGLANNGRLTYGNANSYVDSGDVPVTYVPDDNLSPPHVEWTGTSEEVVAEIGHPNIHDNGASERTYASSPDPYPHDVHSPAGRPSYLPDDSSRNLEDFPQPETREEIQQVQEPSVVTIVAQTKGTTDKPLPECANSSAINAEAALAIVTIGLAFRPLLELFNN